MKTILIGVSVVDSLERMARTYPPDANLAAVLREIRTSQGRSQETVAYEAGLTAAAFGRIERGQADPSWTSVVRIADVLGVSLADIGKRFEARRTT